MRPLRALIPVLRRQPTAALAREAAWRFFKPYRSAHFLSAIRRGETSLHFRPVPYFQPDLDRAALATPEITAYADQICAGRFPFLGYDTFDLGFPPQWNRDFVSGFEWEHLPVAQVPTVRHNGSDVKVPWDLSRLQYLPALAKAHRLTGEPRYRQAAIDLFSDWNAKNPVGIGVNWTLAMETALRGMSLCFMLSLLQPLRLEEEAWGKQVVHSIWQHLLFTESCIEFSHLIRSNHYLGNIVGLHCMATFLDGPGIERRRSSYQQRVQQEILRQVFDDGGDYEASFSYHMLVLQMFTSSYLLMRADNCSLHPEFTARLRAMFVYLSELADQNGRIPHVGDTDDGRVEILNSDLRQMLSLPARDRDSLLAPGFIALGDALFHLGCGGDPSDGAWYGLAPSTKSARSRLTVFPRSGVAIGRTGSAEAIFCAIPNGIHGAGSHTHNDKLSLIARVDGIELLCDSGTLWYTRDTSQRNLFRATAAHNTIAIDEAEQNEINHEPGFAFCIANQAAISTIESSQAESDVRLSASHSGYSRLGVDHCRSVTIQSNKIYIQDVLSGTGEHQVDIFWHLPSAWRISASEAGRCRITGPRDVIMAVAPAEPFGLSHETCRIARTYGGATETGTVIKVSGKLSLPCTVSTEFLWE
jgi:hypothetical protein